MWGKKRQLYQSPQYYNVILLRKWRTPHKGRYAAALLAPAVLKVLRQPVDIATEHFICMDQVYDTETYSRVLSSHVHSLPIRERVQRRAVCFVLPGNESCDHLCERHYDHQVQQRNDRDVHNS